MLKKFDAPSLHVIFQTLKNSQYYSFLSVFQGFLPPTNRTARTTNFIMVVSSMFALSAGVYILANSLSV